eukprot:scaffold9753_cov35-Attheya_sp.AAC.2
MGYLCRSEGARDEAVTESTSEDKRRAWRRWHLFLEHIELLDDDFLEGFDIEERPIILGAFAQAIREAKFSHDRFKRLAEGTVRATVDYVASTFQDFSQRDSRKNSTGQTSRILSRQYRGYRNTDPAVKQQKAIPVCVVRQVGQSRASLKDIAAGQLSPGAFYFAMRSCKYLKVTAKIENRQTKLLCIRNIRFFNRNCLVEHDDPRLCMSLSVSITFEFQKNDKRNDTVTMHRAGDAYMCPVVAWAAVVQRILSYPGTRPETTVNTMYDPKTKRFSYLTSDDLRIRLRAAIVVIGEDKLGIKAEDIGTHSVRSGSAMT